jgi:hypothetical protein
MPTSVAKGWVRQDGDPRPLLARYQDVSEQLSRLGGSPIVPANEPNLLTMRENVRELERRRMAAAAAVDEHILAAKIEFTAAVHAYHLLHKDVAETHRTIRAFHNDPVYRLVFPDLRGLLPEPLPTQDLLDKKYGGSPTSDDLYYLRKPPFASVGEYRQATAWINDQTFALRNLQSDMLVVTRFPYEEINGRLHRIATALAKRVADLEREALRSTTLLRRLQTQTADALGERLDQIEAQITNLAQVARYVRKTKKELKDGKEQHPAA